MAGFLKIARQVAKTADEKLGLDIAAIDVRGHSSLTDCFIFIGATSHLHVQALEDAIREALAKTGTRPLRSDGRRGHLWRALDYGSVIVHIMERKIREFYGIERLWEEGRRITPKLLGQAAAVKKSPPKKKPRRKTAKRASSSPLSRG